MGDFFERARPNTNWKHASAKDMTVYPAILKEILLGRQNLEVPSCILQKEKNFYQKTNCSHKPYNGFLFLLGVVAFHLTGRQNLEEQTAN